MSSGPNPPSRDLRGRHVLITGGSSGIGLALAQQAAAAGAKVSLIARSREKLEVARTAIRAAGPAATEIAVAAGDVAVQREALEALAEVERVHGAPFAEAWRRTRAVGHTSQFDIMCNYLYRHHRDVGGGGGVTVTPTYKTPPGYIDISV